ncbi:hypothetical protein MAM1_0002c00202 [Mucor ambiguus]|uniref:Uncharacterized protein n=1 Tax=Mucor ambiguus TaxID=91626 RepID=A0A0C9MFT7_9FUNG|nr:hypothetical protein MAM1_0002c00202 [Mucor ambiguus]
MDYDSDSSDFHFPSDTGLAKLSSPLSFKVPESRDWALDEFMQTLQDKPCTEAENLLSFKQYIPVQNEEDEDEDDEDDFLNYGPPKLSLPTLEEKDFLSQLSQHFLNLERIELHDILKGGFTLVQNDIQSNNTQNYSHTTQHISSPPGLSWFNEAVDYGRHEIDNLDTIEIPKRKNNFSPFEQIASGRHGNNNNATTVASSSIRSEQQEITTVVPPQVEKPLPPLPQSTSLPSAAPTTTFVTTSNSSSQKKKGLKYKLKQFVKPFNKSTTTTTTSEKPKKSFIKNTRKFIRNIF